MYIGPFLAHHILETSRYLNEQQTQTRKPPIHKLSMIDNRNEMNEPKPIYMKCGHATTSTLAPDNIPYCPICLCHEVAEKPNLERREAQCPYCRNTKPSSFDLPFFKFRPDQKYDGMYDGCEGWD